MEELLHHAGSPKDCNYLGGTLGVAGFIQSTTVFARVIGASNC